MAGAKGFSFSLEGIEVMVGELDKFTDELDRRLEETLTRLALHILYVAKRLAPLDSGDLEAAMHVGGNKNNPYNVSKVKQMVGMMYIDFGVSPEVDHYAVAQHEGFMNRNGKLVSFTSGEKTLAKMPYEGEMPGKKFLERAIKMNEKLIIDELSKILEG